MERDSTGRATPPAEPRKRRSRDTAQPEASPYLWRWLILWSLFILFTLPAPADTWTNAAGEAFEATALELDGRNVIFERPSGEKIRLPLFSLALEEQQRVKVLLNGPEIPVPLQPAYGYAAAQLDRARLLFTDGQLTDQDYAAQRSDLINSFKKACAEQSYAETSTEVQQLVERLLSR
jgi:hypothetical protein